MSNGDGQHRIEIKISKLGRGWVYFEAGDVPVDRSELPYWLNRAPCDWLLEQADYPEHVRAVR